MTLLKDTYDNKNLYVVDNENFLLLKNIIDKNYKVCKEYKNDNRTYVAKIKIDNKFYLLKNIYPRKKIKQFLSFFKKSESLTTLKNVKNLKYKCGIDELVDCLGSIEIRKNNFLIEESLLMDFCTGHSPKNQNEFIKILDVLKKIYKNNRFHGDCNPNNFLIEDGTDGVKIIDTKLKKMLFGNYRQHFDYMV